MQKVAYNAINSLIIDTDSPLPTVRFTARGDCEAWMVCMFGGAGVRRLVK